MSSTRAKTPTPPPKTANTNNNTNLLLIILRELQSIDSEFPLQYALCLLEVAQDEGLSLTTLAERTNTPLSTTSRIIGALSDHRQRGKPYDLVNVKLSPSSRRQKEIFLSQKGKAIIERLSLIISSKQ